MVKLTPAQIRVFMATLTREKVGASARFKVLRVLRNAPASACLRSVRAHQLYAARCSGSAARTSTSKPTTTPVKQVQRVTGVGLVLEDLKTASSTGRAPAPGVLRSRP
ncbi:hypothetical protein [Streptomyces sp. NPDC052012]|uniref:hypothetical protein n=1 Tax=Streptomyces sp. NPDC052012 TaxID=3155051 RepID=UPI00344DC1DE